MSTSPRSPRILKSGLVLIDPGSAAIQRVIPLQYNPDSLTRSLQIRGSGGEGGDRAEALRLTGPPVETLRLEAELDATDQLEAAARGDDPGVLSLHPVLAALETVIYPASDRVRSDQELAQSGVLEILPVEAPLTLFIWSARRVLPVLITEFSVSEEAFDPDLNPIRAKVSLSMRVLTAHDAGFDHKAATLFTAHHKAKEDLARLGSDSRLKDTFGIRRIP